MDRVTRLVNRLLDGIIIFQTKTNVMQDLHIIWYAVLMFTIVCPISKCPKIQQDKNLSNFDKLRCQNNGNLKIYDFLQKLKKVARIVSHGPAISQSDCRKAGPCQLPCNKAFYEAQTNVIYLKQMSKLLEPSSALLGTTRFHSDQDVIKVESFLDVLT